MRLDIASHPDIVHVSKARKVHEAVEKWLVGKRLSKFLVAVIQLLAPRPHGQGSFFPRTHGLRIQLPQIKTIDKSRAAIQGAAGQTLRILSLGKNLHPRTQIRIEIQAASKKI